MEDKNKIFLTLLLYFSPLWFYYKWTHPEVFTFTLLMIGLIDYYNKRVKSAVFFTALASVQNPAAALVPFLIMIGELIRLIKDFSKTKLYNFIVTGIISLIVFIPFIFYYYYFGTFSLIGKYATDLHTISLAKILSLFFDLNFGLIIYVPVIFGLIIYSVIKRNIYAIISLITVVLFAVIDSAQLNWNPGIMLIHRYSYWMIPVLLFGCLYSFKYIKDKTKIILVVLSAIIITSLFAAFILNKLFAVCILTYLLLNFLYSARLKHIAIVDIIIISCGFVIRVIAGGILVNIIPSQYLILLTFLISIFIALAKRYDDVLLDSKGLQTRKNIDGYNKEFILAAIAITAAINIVTYILYTLSDEIISQFNSQYIYLTSIFVVTGFLRYLQLTFVENDSCSPTNILYKDKFILTTLALWFISFVIIIYT